MQIHQRQWKNCSFPLVSPLKMLLKFLSFIEYRQTYTERLGGWKEGTKIALSYETSLCDKQFLWHQKKDYKN